jgi:SSS family solute:Na+ symporter
MGVAVVVGAALMVLASDSLFGRLKLLWEFGVIYSAGFWMGILWKRTNRAAVWTSIAATFVLFFLLPSLVPALAPSMRGNDYLLKQTNERVISRVYTAHPADIAMREAEIREWKEKAAAGLDSGLAPLPLDEGESFTRDYLQPGKSIFWNQGIGMDAQGRPRGEGMLSLELLFLDWMGFSLERNPYALNETLRIIIRTLFPFLVIVLVSLFSRHRASELSNLERFYVKMKTPVQDTPEKDILELERSYAEPTRFDHLKVFPRSQWQFTRWDRTDTIGFIVSVGMVFLILGLLYLVVNLGGKIG